MSYSLSLIRTFHHSRTGYILSVPLNFGVKSGGHDISCPYDLRLELLNRIADEFAQLSANPVSLLETQRAHSIERDDQRRTHVRQNCRPQCRRAVKRQHHE